MLVSELIRRLQEVQAAEGDIEVDAQDGAAGGSVYGTLSENGIEVYYPSDPGLAPTVLLIGGR